MKNKNPNNRLHLEIQTHRINPIGLIRSSYRDANGKVQHQTLSRLNGLSLEQLKLIQASIQGNAVLKSELKILDSKEYGASYSAFSLSNELGLDKLIYSKHSEQWVRDSLAMIIGRLVFSGSKLALSNCTTFSALWNICGISDTDIDVDKHCYNSMDKLLARQEKIQQGLVKKHLTQDSTLVLYDITSSYFEGEYNDSQIVEFGYNRDGKRGHRQIVIALVCNKEGCPVSVEVFAGNTKDETTVCDKLREIRQKYGVENLVFVGDRGMVTKAQYEKIDHDVIKVISALTHNNIRELCAQNVIQLSLFDEKNIVEVSDGKLRYCLCKNPLTAARETATRQALLDKTAQELDAIVQSTRKTKYSKEVRIGRVIGKYNMAKFVVLTGTGDDISWKYDEQKIAEEKSLDGCYVIYSDTDIFSETEIVETYKNLIKVEQAFRSLKTTQLEIRPVYHRTDTRIRCHVFICMLSYYLMWHMKQRLKPLMETREKGKARKNSFVYIMEVLKSIRQNVVDFCGVRSNIISETTLEQANILQLLKVKL